MGYITKDSTERTKGLKTKLCIFLTLGVLCLTVVVVTFTLDLIVIISNFFLRVDYGTYVHELLMKETDIIHLSAYLFNVTNADQFLGGEDEKLRVQEVGPFTYQEKRTNEGLEIDNEAGVIRYTPRQRLTFLPDESVADPQDVIVTMPNIVMLTSGSAASNYGYLAKMGFNVLTMQQRRNATVTRASDYLWGYDEPLIKFGNRFLPGWISFDKLGLLDGTMGMAMTTRFSIQVNVMVNDVTFNSQISRFSNMLVPILNLKIIQPKLPDHRISTLRLVHVYGPYLLLGLQVVLISAGLLLLSFAARLLYWNRLYARKKVISFETK